MEATYHDTKGNKVVSPSFYCPSCGRPDELEAIRKLRVEVDPNSNMVDENDVYNLLEELEPWSDCTCRRCGWEGILKHCEIDPDAEMLLATPNILEAIGRVLGYADATARHHADELRTAITTVACWYGVRRDR